MTAGTVLQVPDPIAYANLHWGATSFPNVRWLKPGGGIDTGPGTSKSGAWNTFAYAQANCPANTILIIVDGVYTGLSSPIGDGWALNIIIRSENPLGAKFSGTGQFATYNSPLTKVMHFALDTEDWGDIYGNGNITWHQCDGFIQLGCVGVDPGDGSPTGQDHNNYMAGGSSYANAPKNWIIAYCQFRNSVPNCGALVLHSYGSGWLGHDGLIDSCVASGSGMKWAFLITAGYASGNPTNIKITNCDIRMVFTDAMIRMFYDYGGGAPNSGADSTFVVDGNVLVALPGSSGNFWQINTPAGSAHNPTSRNNRYWGATVGITLGSGDVVAAPLTDQATISFASTTTTASASISGFGELSTTYVVTSVGSNPGAVIGNSGDDVPIRFLDNNSLAVSPGLGSITISIDKTQYATLPTPMTDSDGYVVVHLIAPTPSTNGPVLTFTYDDHINPPLTVRVAVVVNGTTSTPTPPITGGGTPVTVPPSGPTTPASIPVTEVVFISQYTDLITSEHK